MIELNKIYNEDCIEGMKRIPDESIDCILTDPPYQYLKNQKLDIPFDEETFFNDVKRVLKPSGFIVMFGRGTAFYRWNTMLANLGFNFKEEIIWDKRYSTSPLLPLHRVHETVSLHCKGKGKINKVKVPYLEMKQYDIDGLVNDIKRLKTVFHNTKSLDAVMEFLENNNREANCSEGQAPKLQHPMRYSLNRAAAVMQGIKEGMNEKTIIRSDRVKTDNFTKYGISMDGKQKQGNRCCNVMQSIFFGMNEKSIIKERRDHYNTIHQTQKPVRLLERLLNLVCDTNTLVLDPFVGSGSTAIACMNTGRNYIGFEIDKEYYDNVCKRIADYNDMVQECNAGIKAGV